MKRRPIRRASVLLAAGFAAGLAAGEAPFTFKNAAAALGLLPALEGVIAHSAAWGDTDGDGRPELYVGTFNKSGAKPGVFFRNAGGGFAPDAQEVFASSGRASGGFFADLDNDGDLDFYLSNNARGHAGTPQGGLNVLLRNEGGGRFSDVSKESGACPGDFNGRSATVLDFDGDGLLDMLVTEDGVQGARLFRNKGGLRFEDVTAAAGLPAALNSNSVAAGDLDNDTWPDLLIVGKGGNRLFLNDARGRFAEALGAATVFAIRTEDGDDMPCGACLGDVDCDGRLDVAIGQHFDHPWRAPEPVRLFLNRGGRGAPAFEDVTEAAGLKKLPMKAPHVELQDFDNDGRPDLYTSVVKFDGADVHPLIYRNLGGGDGRVRFREDCLAVNDFPAEEDRAPMGSGAFFRKMLAERKIMYFAPGPSADFDRDGRLDLCLPSWWAEVPSLLLRNETRGGRWLRIRVAGRNGTNRMGVGAKVILYAEGRLGDAAARIGHQEIAVGYGYCSGQEAVAHFGLGAAAACDLEVILPHGKGRLERKGVKADQELLISGDSHRFPAGNR